VLILTAVIVSFLNLLDVLPLITNKFYFKDDTNILYGVSYQDMPQGILTFTYACWWRPLGFGLPMFINWLFGISSLGFHILGLCNHFALGLTIWWFARRLFSVPIAWLSYIFYMISLNGVAAVGFPVNSFQDSLFTCFFLLGWGLMFPRVDKQALTPKSYLPSAVLLFIAALCKDSWLGALPVFLITDWVLVRKSNLKERFKRLAPFLILLSIPVLHFTFFDITILLNSMYLKYININSFFVTLLKGFITPFLPFINLEVNQKWHYLSVFLVIAIMVASLYSGFNRARIVLIVLMFGLILLILSPSFINVFWINVRIASLASLSSILLSLALIAFARMFRNVYLVSSIIIVAVFAFYVLMSDSRGFFIRFMTG
jgi:hypothetical protein